LLDSFTGKEVHRFTGHTGSVTRLVWSPDGRRLLSGSHDSSCLIWDVSAEIRATLPANPVTDREARALVEALSGPDATAAYAAMGKLVASPASAVSAIREKLRPVPAPDEAKIAALVRDLDSPQFAARERAAAELGRLGEIAEGPLKKARAGPLSAEAGDRVDKLLADLQPSTGRLWQGRALDVLQRTGGPDAKRFLEELAAGADGAWLTREAKAALVRTHP
jgi:hypothetical protein